MVVGAGAVATTVALAGWLALVASATARWPAAGLALAGAVAVAAGLRWPVALALGLVLPGAGYALLLAVDEPPLDQRAAAVAAALVLIAGLADWSLELRTTSPDEEGTRWGRLGWVSLAAAAALALGGVLLAIVDLARTEGIAVEALGAAAALLAVVLIARLAAGPRT